MVFSRGHATLHFVVLVGSLVGLSVRHISATFLAAYPALFFFLKIVKIISNLPNIEW